MAFLRVVDATLCTSCQAAGMSFDEKLFVAEQLAASKNIDVIDTGFPALLSQGPGETLLVKEMARRIRDVAIAGHARALVSEIEAAWSAIQEADHPVRQVAVMTSEWYREEELKGDQEVVIAHVKVMVADARKRCPTVSFLADDATRTEHALLCRIVEAAIGQGATAIVLPERLGHATSFEYGTLFHGVRERLKPLLGGEQGTLGAHTHNRLGLATANTVAAVRAGAGQIAVDRAGRGGHPALEEIEAVLVQSPEILQLPQKNRGDHA